MVWLVSASLGVVLIAQQPAKKVDFSRDIQPVFERSCYSCHGPKSQMANLRLDSKAAAARVIVPGKPAESSLYQRIAGIGDVVRMPMGGKLDQAQIDTIRAWIEEGAEWPDGAAPAVSQVKKHWAFVPPIRPAVPKPGHPIDAFITARLEKEGLHLSPEADRATLLRRLSLDLIGLPPAPEEIDAFLKDESKNAYEKQVDRLLASPHYGERWARIWLDGARYADSNGYEKDRPRQVWFYRDWVINSLNRNLPYDQFVIDQIAGDELPDATQDQIVATGFLRNSMVNEEGGVDPEQFRMEAMFDRMDAIGKSILGVTIQCAQCHNHKFDPLMQEEYYRMLAFLNNSDETEIAVYTPEQEARRASVYRETRAIEAELRRKNRDWRERMAAWERSVANDQPQWTVIRPEIDDISTGGQKYMPLPDGSFLAGGYAPTRITLKLTAKTDLQNITGFRLELLTDPNLPLGGPGRSTQGMAAVSEFRVSVAPVSAPDKSVKINIASATADIALPETELGPSFQDEKKKSKTRVIGPVAYAIDGKDETAWGIDAGPGLRNQPRKAVFVPEQPISNPGGTVLNLQLAQLHGGTSPDYSDNNNLGRFRLSITNKPNPSADPLPKAVRDLLAVPAGDRTEAQVETIFRYWRTTVPAWREANEKIAGIWKEFPAGEHQLVASIRHDPRQTHVLARGDFLKPGKVVTPGVPAFLHPLPANAPPTRLSFARWLVDRKSPTTARSFVNRVWQAYFGTGIVASSENLGTQAEPPSHPELLDWLAVEFMDSGWDIKKLQRLIVTSAAYRQSSKVTPELLSKDPYNRLLARGPRFRVDAEIVHDIALEAAGLLNGKVGGPSVFPPAPAFLFVPPASYAPKPWKESEGADRYRRGIYIFRYRSVPYPALETFDAPNGDASCVRRARSNTPLQALTTMNEPVFMEAAEALAKHTLERGGASDAQRIAYAFRRCVGRVPAADETNELLAMLRDEEKHYAETKADDPRTAAWTAVSRVLLNLDETVTKE